MIIDLKNLFLILRFINININLRHKEVNHIKMINQMILIILLFQ